MRLKVEGKDILQPRTPPPKKKEEEKRPLPNRFPCPVRFVRGATAGILQALCYIQQNSGLSDVLNGADGVLVAYSVEDRRSFEIAIDCLYEIKKRRPPNASSSSSSSSSASSSSAFSCFSSSSCSTLAVTLAANKTDLVRTRTISEQGQIF